MYEQSSGCVTNGERLDCVLEAWQQLHQFIQGHGELAIGESLPNRVIVGSFSKGQGWRWTMTYLLHFRVHPIDVGLIGLFDRLLSGLVNLVLNLPF